MRRFGAARLPCEASAGSQPRCADSAASGSAQATHASCRDKRGCRRCWLDDARSAGLPPALACTSTAAPEECIGYGHRTKGKRATAGKEEGQRSDTAGDSGVHSGRGLVGDEGAGGRPGFAGDCWKLSSLQSSAHSTLQLAEAPPWHAAAGYDSGGCRRSSTALACAGAPSSAKHTGMRTCGRAMPVGTCTGSKAQGTHACKHPHANAHTEQRALARTRGFPSAAHRNLDGMSLLLRTYGLGLDSAGKVAYPRGAEIGAEGSAAARAGARFSMTMGCGYGGTAAPPSATCTPAGSGVLEGSTAAPCGRAKPTRAVHRITHSQLLERAWLSPGGFSGRERTAPPREEPVRPCPPRQSVPTNSGAAARDGLRDTPAGGRAGGWAEGSGDELIR